jgi:hypothetical protein
LPKLREPVEEVEDGRFELALGAVKGGVDNFLAQKLPQALNQVQIGRIRGQKGVLLPKGYCWRIGFKPLLAESTAQRRPDAFGLRALRLTS